MDPVDCRVLVIGGGYDFRARVNHDGRSDSFAGNSSNCHQELSKNLGGGQAYYPVFKARYVVV